MKKDFGRRRRNTPKTTGNARIVFTRHATSCGTTLTTTTFLCCVKNISRNVISTPPNPHIHHATLISFGTTISNSFSE